MAKHKGFDIFGSSAFDDDERRYSVSRSGERPWEPIEELVMWPVLLACDSEASYYEAVKFFLALYDREPKHGPHKNPTSSKKYRKRLDMFEARTVTRHLHGSSPDVVNMAWQINKNRRERWRFTYVDFLYLVKYLEKQSPIPMEEFSRLMGRDMHFLDLVCSKLVKGHITSREIPERKVTYRMPTDRAEELTAYVQDVLDTEYTAAKLQKPWDALHKHLEWVHVKKEKAKETTDG